MSAADRSVLQHELMAARRAVRTARAGADGEAERAARMRVHAAKVGLGERGSPWWEQSANERAARIQDALDGIELDRPR